MILVEADSFKIDLINDLNNQRVDGINCDIEIESSYSSCKIYSHSIILNLFSETLRSFIKDRMKMMSSMPVCKINFPNEVEFIKTDCFDCFKQVIDYFYEGELNIDAQHESHLKDIVYSLKIERLIHLLFSSYEGNDALSNCRTLETCDSSILESSQPSSKLPLQFIPTPCPSLEKVTMNEILDKNICDSIKTTDIGTKCKPFEILQNGNSTNDTDLNRETKNAVQSPPKKRIKANYENNTNYPNTSSIMSKGGNISEEMHSDGLHLLLSILEEENRKEFLIPESNLHSTSKKCTSSSEIYYNQQEINSSKQVIVKTDDKVKDPQESIIYQALISRTPYDKLDQDTNTNVESSTLNSKINEPTCDSKQENGGPQKKKKVGKNQGRGSKRKSGFLKKKENLDKVIGVQDGYMCKKCKMFFDNLSSLQEHLQSTHSKKFRCIACNFMTIKIRYFIDHLIQNRHEGTICSICHFQTTTNEELQRHIVKHEQNLPKPFFCNDCDKTFPTRRSWSVHLPVHSYETQFLCAVCSKGFKWSQGLQNHMSTHVNEKLYPCGQCSFLTASRANLAKHTLKHDTKKEVCPYEECKYREIRKENLKAHLLTHSKVKRFQCELCGKSFAQARNLDRHLESVHNPQKLALGCNQCNYMSVRLDKLKDHFKSSHKTYDYTQYLGKLKEDMKSRSLLGAKVNRHVLASTKKYNFDNHADGDSRKYNSETHADSGTQQLSVSHNQTGNNQMKANIVTLPVLNQDSMFRVGNIDRNTLPILMNVNQMTTTNLMRPLVKPNLSSTLPKTPVLAKSRNRTRKSKSLGEKTNLITSNRDRKKKQLKNLVKSNNFISSASTPKKILPLIKTPQNTVVTNTPIFLILSSTVPRNQLIPNKTDANLIQNPSGNQPIKVLFTNQTQAFNRDLANTNTSIHTKEIERNGSRSPCRNLDSGNNSQPPSIDKNNLCCASNNVETQHNEQKNQPEQLSNDKTGSLMQNSVNTDVSKSASTSSFPNSDQRSGNYIDVLDESTGELLFLTSKHINNPFLDEATGELSVFEIPSSFINYIENLTGSSDYDTILPERTGANRDDLADYSYRGDSFPLFLNDEHVSSWSDSKHFILDELTGELNVTTKR